VSEIEETSESSADRPDGRRPNSPPWSGGWTGRVAFAGGPDGFAYHPGQVLVPEGRDALATALAVARRQFPDAPITDDPLDGSSGYTRLDGVPDVLRLVGAVRRAGVMAQPNHVFFAHCGDCCCGPHPAQLWGGRCGSIGGSPAYASSVEARPAYASAVGASPAYASPAYASPAYASPAYASPAYASPAYASDEQATGHRHSSARPALEPYIGIAGARLDRARAAMKAGPPAAGRVEVVILDTGLAGGSFAPTALDTLVIAVPYPDDEPDHDADTFLDPAAGHGTFIAGLIQQLAPGTAVAVRRVLHAEGDGDEVQIAQAMDALPAPPAAGALLNLSFGGYVMDHPGVLGDAVARAQDRGYVVVASAGNDGTCRPQYPAVLPGVIAVGAVGPNGPAPFTNYGSFVRACAPGVDLVSTFFDRWNGGEPAADPGSGNAHDPDEFAGWACWSGTSFSCPVVVGALAHEMEINGVTAAEAVTRIIDNPSLLRIPGLGTVVDVL
jgi:hypothetical protein